MAEELKDVKDFVSGEDIISADADTSKKNLTKKRRSIKNLDGLKVAKNQRLNPARIQKLKLFLSIPMLVAQGQHGLILLRHLVMLCH